MGEPHARERRYRGAVAGPQRSRIAFVSCSPNIDHFSEQAPRSGFQSTIAWSLTLSPTHELATISRILPVNRGQTFDRPIRAAKHFGNVFDSARDRLYRTFS
jgi:hypothetical protein